MSSHSRRIFDELLAEVRRSQSATARFDRAVADAVGLNLTDMACLDFLGQLGPVTAGRLAELTGLSSGAMTAALDRLERAGYARRRRDSSDRRRVLVELTGRTAEIDAFYAEHAAVGKKIADQYTTEQLELLLQFVRQSREFNERRAAEVEREARAGGGRAAAGRAGKARAEG